MVLELEKIMYNDNKRCMENKKKTHCANNVDTSVYEDKISAIISSIANRNEKNSAC